MEAQKLDSIDSEPRRLGRARHRRPDQQREEHEASIARLQARVMARSDGEARIAQVERLKTQVEAGTYCMDSTAIAQKMLTTLFAPARARAAAP